MNIRLKPLAVLLPLAFSAQFSVAQQNQLDPVVVTARGYDQPLSEVLPSVSVITRNDIDRLQARHLAELMQGEPGFEFGRNGGPGTITSFFLRGADSKNVAVFIDGVRAQTDNIGSINLTDIPLNNVERVEILRGNASALYGEAAIGGVINIKTRMGTGEPNGYGKITVGSRNTTDLSAGYGGKINDTRFNLSFSSFETAGFSAKNTPSSNPDKDGYRNLAASASIVQKLGATTEAGVVVNSVRAKVDYDEFSFVRTDNDVFETDTDNVSAFLKTSLIKNVVTRLEVTHSNFTYRDLKNGSPRTSADYKDGIQQGEQTSYGLSNLYAIDETANISFGANHSASTYALSSYTNATNYRNSTGVYLGGDKKLGNLSVQANLRRDELEAGREGGVSNDYGKTTHLLGFGYQLTEQFRLTATHSTGFRAPAPYEFIKSPNLKPEMDTTNEAGVEYRNAISRFRVVYFDTKSTDAIYYNPTNYTYQNLNVHNRGIETTGEISANGYTAKLSYTSQDPVNTDLNIQQARRAKEFASLQLFKDIGATSLGGKLIWSGSRKDSDFSNTRLASYTVLNLFASYKINPEWTTRLMLENVTNEKYELASGYNTPGRGVFISLQYQPK